MDEEKVKSEVSYEYVCCEPECQKRRTFPSWQGKHTLFSGGSGARCIECGAGLSFAGHKGVMDKRRQDPIDDVIVQREMLVILREIRDSLHGIQVDLGKIRALHQEPVEIRANVLGREQWV